MGQIEVYFEPGNALIVHFGSYFVLLSEFVKMDFNVNRSCHFYMTNMLVPSRGFAEVSFNFG